MATFKELKRFAIGWRFTDEKYNIVNENDFFNATINSPEKSQQKWEKHTGSNQYHLMLLPQIFWFHLEKVGELRLEWVEENSDNNKKLSMIKFIENDNKITFFWGGSYSIDLDWGIFLKYWDDFCYPDDDNLIVCENKNLYFTYIDDCFSTYKFKK
jgi:hypothetical protein